MLLRWRVGTGAIVAVQKTLQRGLPHASTVLAYAAALLLGFLGRESPQKRETPPKSPSGVCLLSRQNNPPRDSSCFQLPLPAPVLAFHLPQLQTSTSTTTAAAPRLAAASTPEIDAFPARFTAPAPAASDRLAHPPFAQINGLQLRYATTRASIRLPPFISPK